MTRSLTCISIGVALLLAVHPAAIGQEPTADQYMSMFVSYFDGDWDHTTTQNDGATTKGTWSCQLSPTKTCLLLFATENGKPSMHSIGGYDPSIRAWKETGFDGNGGNYTLTYRLPLETLTGESLGKTLKGTFDEITKDGKKGSGEIIITMVKRDRWEAVFQNQTRDGKRQPDLKAVFERKQK